MLFAVWAVDAPSKLAAREAVRERHRARLRAPAPHELEVVLAGPTLDASGAMAGTMLVIEAHSIDAVRAFINADPYVEAGVYASVDIRPWRCGLGTIAANE